MSESKWDLRFLEVAKLVSSWSKDPSRKVGAVIVGKNREIRSTGYNGFPRNIDDSKTERYDRPAKYIWTEHAERNAIYNASNNGAKLSKCTLYVTLYPCADCTRAIIQCGIKKVVVDMTVDAFAHEKWGDQCRVSEQMMKEAGIEVLKI